MRKYLVFYPVDNEFGFDRHTFDLMTDEEAWKELRKSEWIRVYEMTRSDRNGRMLDMGDFVEDYNDEELDGGWWSILLTLPDEEEEERKLIGYQVLDVNDDIPDGLFSFQVFRSEQDAKDFIEERGLKECTIHEIYDGDIEEPSFLGKKPRTFKQGERVFNCEYSAGDKDLHDWATVCHDTEVEEEDDIVLIQMENGGENETTAESLYQIAEGKACPRCGGPLCIEHHDEIDYPYFCPSCDENFYGIEVQ